MGNRVSRITDDISRRKKKDTGHDPVAVSASLIDRQYNSDYFTGPTESAPQEEEMPDLKDPELEQAAIKIQASFKGYKTRKELGDQSPDQAEQDTSPIPPNGEPVPNKESSVDKEEVDIDLKDPDVEAAALKIQSSFRSLQKKKTVESVEGSIDGTDAEHKANVTKEENTKELTQAVETPPTAAPVDGETNKESVSGNTELETAQSQKNDNKEDSDDTKDKDKVSAKPEEGNSKEVPSAETADETAVQTPATTTADPTGVTPAETEEVDIDLEDPDVAAAALRIQANFRGNLMRKKKKGFGANKNMENQE